MSYYPGEEDSSVLLPPLNEIENRSLQPPPPKRRRKAPVVKEEEYEPDDEDAYVRQPKRPTGVRRRATQSDRADDWQERIERLRVIEDWAARARETVLGSVPKRQTTPRPKAKKAKPKVPNYESGFERTTWQPLGGSSR
jgi:hypothetical protein